MRGCPIGRRRRASDASDGGAVATTSSTCPGVEGAGGMAAAAMLGAGRLSRSEEWRCFGCVHVRTATILYGVWHLMLHVFALFLFTMVYQHNAERMLTITTTSRGSGNTPSGSTAVINSINNAQFEAGGGINQMPTPLSNVRDYSADAAAQTSTNAMFDINESPRLDVEHDDDDEVGMLNSPYYLASTTQHEVDVRALVTICTLSVTLLLVYGTFKGRPAYLLPFFCIQLFDFTITCLTVTNYFCYLRSVHQYIAERWDVPIRQELMQMDPRYLGLVVLAWYAFIVAFKAYIINVVWRCYKYLTLRAYATRSTVHYILPGSGPTGPGPDGLERGLFGAPFNMPPPPAGTTSDTDYASLLPDYEAACASAMKQPPPPSYQTVMQQQQHIIDAANASLHAATAAAAGEPPAVVAAVVEAVPPPPVYPGEASSEEDDPATANAETASQQSVEDSAANDEGIAVVDGERGEPAAGTTPVNV